MNKLPVALPHSQLQIKENGGEKKIESVHPVQKILQQVWPFYILQRAQESYFV